MKTLRIIFSAGILSIIFFGCKTTKTIGTSNVGPDIYIDQTEIDVKSWLSYYTWILENEGKQAAAKILPDSLSLEPSVWNLIKMKTDKYSNSTPVYTLQPLGYFYDECDKNFIFDCNTKSTCPSLCLRYPITGISYEQVIEFCKWRTKIVNENPIFKTDKKQIVFRLPTEKEWVQFAKIGFSEQELKIGFRDSLAIMQNKKVKCRECPMYNYKTTSSCDSMPSITVTYNGCYAPDGKNTYDLFGNVSEMTSIKGISKGGNYLLFAKQCHPDSIQKYVEPEKWLGFRCIAIIENK
jgi:formylglycine-generating enzyme required for sulfatase activity